MEAQGSFTALKHAVGDSKHEDRVRLPYLDVETEDLGGFRITAEIDLWSV